MAKLTGENWVAELDGDEYCIPDGGEINLNLPPRIIDQRGSCSFGANDAVSGLASDAAVTCPILVDATELAAIRALKGTSITGAIVDKSGSSDTDQFRGTVICDHEETGTIGDNVQLNITMKLQALPTTPDLSALDTTVA